MIDKATMIAKLRGSIERMIEAGVTPRVLQVNQATYDALAPEIDTLGLRVTLHSAAGLNAVHILQREPLYNVGGKVFFDSENAEDYIDHMFGCEVYGVDWINITTMDDAVVGREVWIADLAAITCGVWSEGEE